MLNFYINDKYDIKYSLYKNATKNLEEKNKNEDLNPHLNFTIDIKRISNNLEVLELGNQFFLLSDNMNIIERNQTISSTSSNMSFGIVYLCLFNCSWEGNKDINETDIIYVLTINYSGYKIDHQDDDIPLERNNDKHIFSKKFYFSFNKFTLLNINWEVIKYKEERGLFGLFDNFLNKKNEFTSIDIGSYEQSYTERPIEEADPESSLLIIRGLAFIRMINNQHINNKFKFKFLL
jgi:hypothetical protein